jgi:hypothetical protein
LKCLSLKAIIGSIGPFYTGNDIEEYASHYLYSLLDADHYFLKRIPTGLADSEEGLRL